MYLLFYNLFLTYFKIPVGWGDTPSTKKKRSPQVVLVVYRYVKYVYVDTLSLRFALVILLDNYVHLDSFAFVYVLFIDVFVIFLKTPSTIVFTTSCNFHWYFITYLTISTQDDSHFDVCFFLQIGFNILDKHIPNLDLLCISYFIIFS